MPPKALDKGEETLAGWQQGDVIIEGAPTFVHLADLARPLTKAAREWAETDPNDEGDDTSAVIETQPLGIVVVTQTCDIVRSWSDRPYVEVSPLVLPREAAVLEEVRRKERPQYAYLPGIAHLGLIADLDL